MLVLLLISPGSGQVSVSSSDYHTATIVDRYRHRLQPFRTLAGSLAIPSEVSRQRLPWLPCSCGTGGDGCRAISATSGTGYLEADMARGATHGYWF